MEEKIYIESTDDIKLCALMSNVSKDKVVLLCHGIRGDKNERGSLCCIMQKNSKYMLKIWI